MEWAKVKTSWSAVQSKVHTKWDKLPESELKSIGGQRDALVKSLEKHYKMDHSKAEKSADEFVKTLS